MRFQHDKSRITSFIRTASFNDQLDMGCVDYFSNGRLLEKMTRLKTLHWFGSYHIPQAFLDILETKLPDVCLELEASIESRNISNFEGWGNDLRKMKGSGSPLLKKLKLNIDQDGGMEQRIEQRMLSEVIKNSPNLKYIHNDSESRYLHNKLLKLKLGESDLLPRLDHLHFLSLKQTDYEIWIAKGGMKNLKTLAVHSLACLAPFKGHVPHLQHFTLMTLQDYDREEAITSDAAFVNLGPVRRLQLCGHFGKRLPVKSIVSYKETLTDLRIHSENEDNLWAEALQVPGSFGFSEEDIISLHSDLEVLSQECQKIERLHLDLYAPREALVTDKVEPTTKTNFAITHHEYRYSSCLIV